jgi:hypothetical protein
LQRRFLLQWWHVCSNQACTTLSMWGSHKNYVFKNCWSKHLKIKLIRKKIDFTNLKSNLLFLKPSYNGLFCERNSFQVNTDVAQPSTNYQIISANPNNNNNNNETPSPLLITPTFVHQQTSTSSYPSAFYVTSNLNRPKLSICDFDPCLNFGQCLPINDRKSFFKFQCVCPDYYSGILCERYTQPSQQPPAMTVYVSQPYTPPQQPQPTNFQLEQQSTYNNFMLDLTTQTYQANSNQVEYFTVLTTTKKFELIEKIKFRARNTFF